MGNADEPIGDQKFKVLIINSSLQKKSTNGSLLRECEKVGHKNIQFQWVDLSDVPMFNEDLQTPLPQSVQRIKQQVKGCVGILVGVAEYNFSVTPALKNIYDWLSRGGFIKGYPFGIVAVGSTGSTRARKHLRQIGEYCQIDFMAEDLEVLRFAPGNFDAEGKLVSNEVKTQIQPFLHKFAQHLLKNSKLPKGKA